MFGIGKVIYTEWGDAVVRELYEDGDIGCAWEGFDGVFTISVPRVRVGTVVGTRYGEAKVVKVYGDGDIACVWDGTEGEFTVGLNEVFVQGQE